ncbi:hypothetical protein HCU66_15455 [Pseudomonas frederiksbergensis]|uniref:hypothetical protein n=1 Tax=Pseudomonas frederiksbergensis TaxID=104087 RepID=UPI001981E99B|nr:hypothetical protein [Pseudomonas frederiksbergensis]MBN3863634.1 hypothetical protein [Pseudomonas frederiksbergensis]
MYSKDMQPAHTADQLQKQEIITTITEVIGNEHAIEHLEWAWNRILVPCVGGTSFDQIHRPAKVSLSILVRHSDFLTIRNRRAIPQSAIFLVDDRGRLYFSYRNLIGNNNRRGTAYVSPKDITADVAGLADFDNELKLLANMAKLTGGWITSGDHIVVGQWLRFQGLQVPNNEQDTRSLLDLLNFSTLPESPKYGNYWDLLDAPDDSPFKLDEKHRAIIRQVTEDLTGGETSLVAHFGAHLMLESTSADALSTSTNYRLQRLIELAVWSSGQAQDYIEALGWFANEAESRPTPELVEQLLIAAMLLDLDPALDVANTTFAGFDLYSKRYFKRHPSYVRSQLEKHLVDSLNLDPLFAPLVAELVLGGMTPQYLFAEWPSGLQMGTPAWVVGTQAVHLAEALIPGVTRKMTYQQLLGFGQSAKAMPQLASLQASHSVDPVVTWALMNGLITHDAEGNVNQEAITHATQEYEQYLNKLLSAAEAFSKPLPDRRQLALKELKSAVPDCDPDERLVKHRGSGGGAGRKVSLLDLYMGDELHTQDWDRIRGTSLYNSYPALAQLFPVAELYEPAIEQQFNAMTGALASYIEVALSQLHPEDARYIEYGALGIYCIQKIDFRDETVSARPGVTIPAAELPGETGRYGVIICAQYANNTIRCFELFPMRMECRYNPELEEIFTPLISGDFHRLDTTFVDRKKIESIPIDIRAYLQNLAPRDNANSRLYIRKIAELKPLTGDPDPDYPNPYFRSARKEALGELIAKENPYITQSEIRQLGLHQTQRERAIEKTEAIFNTLLNLIIPFKECVEGLASADAKKQGAAIVDCVVDAAVLALTIAAVPVKIVASSTKAATMATRLLSASRVLAGTTLSLFNPLDGLPKLLRGGGKLLGRGVSKLSAHTLSTTRQARQQLRYLTGANSYNLLKAIDHTGSASRIRMSLDTVTHARAVFKSDLIENAEQILKQLHANDTKLLGNIPEQELTHLLENALVDIALKADSAQSLKTILDPQVVDSLVKQQAQKYSLANLHQFRDHTTLPELFDTTLQIEYKNLTYMQAHQNTLIAKDLGKAPFDRVLDELTFNPGGLTDNTDRATAWILNASSSRNELDSIKNLLLEYSANGKPLNDPAVYTELHRRIAPRDTGGLRSPTGEARYPSNVSGAALLEKHATALDPANEHFAKQMLGAMLGYHSFVDGNGRTARAVYAIAELRKGRFNALGKTSEDALSGLA